MAEKFQDLNSIRDRSKVYRALIIYHKEDNCPAYALSGFLRICCSVHCEIDSYHGYDNVSDWSQWTENQITFCAMEGGFILFLCSENIYRCLQTAGNEIIEMEVCHINKLRLCALMNNRMINKQFVPVLIDHENDKYIPKVLEGRRYFTVSSKALQALLEVENDVATMLDLRENQSLKSLVAKLVGQTIIEIPATVSFDPCAPTDIKFKVLLPNVIEVTWCPSLSPGITSYLIVYTTEDVSESLQVSGESTSACLSHLKIDCTYHITVQAISNNRKSDTSCEIEVSTSHSETKIKQGILISLRKARHSSIKVRYGKVLFCGAGAAGKTNFINLLLEDNFECKHVSTELAKPQQVSAVKAQVWQDNKEPLFRKMNIDEEIIQLMSYLPKESTKPELSDATVCKKPFTIAEDIISSKLSSGTKESTKPESSDATVYKKSVTIAEDIISSKLASGTISTGAETKAHTIASDEKIWDILTFIDTGGQPQFISMLPAVNTFAMVTFVVHKMTGGAKSLNDKVLIQHGDKDGNSSFNPHPDNCTQLQLIKTLLSYASHTLIYEEEFLNELKAEKNGKTISSHDCSSAEACSRSISVVGTHSGNVSEEQIKEIDTLLTKKVKYFGSDSIKPSLNPDFEYLMPVDNKEQGKGSSESDKVGVKYTDPSKIRSYIIHWLNKQDVYSVPVQWLLLELEIRKVCIDRKCSCIALSEIFKLSKEKDLGDNEFIKSGLRFHHLFGTLLFFEQVKGIQDLVITDHQWLFNKLTDIVLFSFKDHKVSWTRGDLEGYKEGRFTVKMLDKLDIDTDFKMAGIDTELIDPKTSFLELLQHMQIIAREDNDRYFMPSLLESCNVDDIQYVGSNQIWTKTNEPFEAERMLIRFDKTKSFPRGIFCFLVVQLKHSKGWQLDENVYRNSITFIKKDSNHYISLTDKISFLEVHITSFEGLDRSPIHYQLLEVIKEALLDVNKRLHVNSVLRYGFLCKNARCLDSNHMTYFGNQTDEYCYCAANRFTKLNASHRVWFSSFHKENASLQELHCEFTLPGLVQYLKNVADWGTLAMFLLPNDYNSIAAVNPLIPKDDVRYRDKVLQKYDQVAQDRSWKEVVKRLQGAGENKIAAIIKKDFDIK